MNNYALAALAVEQVCNDRRGLHWDDLDSATRDDLLTAVADIIRHAVEGSEPVKPYTATLLNIAKRRMVKP